MGAGRGQAGPALSREPPAEQLIGEAGLGHAGQPDEAARLRAADAPEAAVDLSVDPADEERRHTAHPGDVASPCGQRLQP
jgi:hypothetical protein